MYSLRSLVKPESANTLEYMSDERLEAPTTVRWTGEQARAIGKLASELGGSSGTAARYLLNLGIRWLASERPAASSDGAPGFFPAPLLAEDVGAGPPRLRMIPGADRRYGFREDWLSDMGWSPESPERFGVYRLADLHARSMEPTIQAGSILLVDREANRDSVPPRSIWIVSRADGLACKRVTVRDGWMVLESDNRETDFAPEALRVTAQARRTMLEGRVVWWATTVE